MGEQETVRFCLFTNDKDVRLISDLESLRTHLTVAVEAEKLLHARGVYQVEIILNDRPINVVYASRLLLLLQEQRLNCQQIVEMFTPSQQCVA